MGVSVGAFSVFAVTMTSGNTITSMLGFGGAWQHVFLRVPTMTSGTEIYLKAGVSSQATDGFRVMFPPVNSSAAQVNTFSVASGVSQRVMEAPIGGLRYIAVEFSTATTATSQSFQFFCSN